MIVLDTSFLIEMIKRKISLPNMKYIIPEPVYREIRAMSKNRGKKGSYARAILDFIKRQCYIVPTDLPPDQAIIELCNKYELELLTFDLKLRKAVKRTIHVSGDYVDIEY
ncbi:MAG: hypothetical protein NZ908_00670 [Candidatus Micrarchaeota archaeon]|nr:hypothetical protein [Candidatus Micrarchaeota archaeon]MCX8154476.1 hypothetical protein [Candidatus Micrarchaeota archaeon]